MNEPFRCADAARQRADPPLGTAPACKAYLLIEHPGPWRFDAVVGAGWSTAVTTALGAAAHRGRARLLLIRRPGRRSEKDVRVWAVSTVGTGTVWGTWRRDADLLEPAALLEAAAALQSAGTLAPGPTPGWSPEPLLLVCVHGVHDTCCAIRGRPVSAALARRWAVETWECSHVGGDRFAANLVVLPDGTYYGNLDAESATATVAGHLGGRLDAAHLRGSARWPPPVQVAIGEVHRCYGPFAVDDVIALHDRQLTPTRWLVEVGVPNGRRFTVEVAAAQRPPAVLTCAAGRATAATQWQVVALAPATSAMDITIS